MSSAPQADGHVLAAPSLPEDAAPNLAPPPGNPRFPLFDSLRAVAALSVFLGHTIIALYSFYFHPQLFLDAVQTSDQGVALFFLISGFLLYRPFLVARRGGFPLSLKSFARRRVLRIVPAYWAALSIALLAGVVNGVNGHNWWVFYGFGQIYSFNTIGHGIGAAWTLCIEMTFYIALPLLSAVGAKLGRRPDSMRGDLVMLAVLSAASLAFRWHFHSFGDLARVSTLPGTFTWFAFGMFLAILSVAQQGRANEPAIVRLIRGHPTLCWLAAAIPAWYLHRLLLHGSSRAALLGQHVLYAVVAMLMLAPAVFADEGPGLVRRALRNRVLAWIGLISYGFYLYHTLVIQELSKTVHGPIAYPVLLVSAFALSCACAAVSYYLLERPAMRLRLHRPEFLH